MAYRQSVARRRWTDERLARMDILATAHDMIGGANKPVAHAYIIGMLGEFQGFARDLHNIAVEQIVSASGAAPQFATILTKGLKKGRAIDRGNATTHALKTDFARIGLSPLNPGQHNPEWPDDAATFEKLIELRNVLGHSNEPALDALIDSGAVNDDMSWARSRHPLLERYVRALDMLVWDHLRHLIGKDPWT